MTSELPPLPDRREAKCRGCGLVVAVDDDTAIRIESEGQYLHHQAPCPACGGVARLAIETTPAPSGLFRKLRDRLRTRWNA